MDDRDIFTNMVIEILNTLKPSDLGHIAILKLRSNLPIIIVLFLALFIRMYGVSTMSLSNDELSGVWRSFMKGSWHDMMANGVMTDGHPPLTYIIMRYWIMLFGDSVLSIRMPFILAGVLGLYYTYRTGVLWFGQTAALLAVSFLAVTTYVIYFHQIARPYSLGFLWVQAAAYYWTQFLFGKDHKGKSMSLVLWVLAAILSCYTHYFSFMAVGLMGTTGLFFLTRQNYNGYLLSGLMIVLALLPGIAIFRQQLSYNGLEWLAPPGKNWLFEYLADVQNNSLVIYITIAVFFCIPVFVGLYRHTLRFNKFQVIGLSWFLISFLVGYFKSIYSMPVLQYSCMVFTYPFLALVFFSFWTDEIFGPRYGAYVFVPILLTIGLNDTACRGRYYSSEHHGEIRGLARQMAIWSDRYGSDMLRVTNVNNGYYWDYYWVRSLHRSEKIALYGIDPAEDIPRFDSLLSHSSAHYFSFAWSNMETPDTLFKVIERHYPNLLADPPHFNSGIRLYSK